MEKVIARSDLIVIEVRVISRSFLIGRTFGPFGRCSCVLLCPKEWLIMTKWRNSSDDHDRECKIKEPRNKLRISLHPRPS